MLLLVIIFINFSITQAKPMCGDCIENSDCGKCDTNCYYRCNSNMCCQFDCVCPGTTSTTVAPTTSTSTTSPPSCSGSVSLSLNPDPATPGSTVTATASGLSNCNGKTVYIRDGACSGTTKGSCTVSGSGCSDSFNGGGSCSPLSQPTYYACIDKNGDNDFSDSGERDYEVLNMDCTTTGCCEFLEDCESLTESECTSYGGSWQGTSEVCCDVASGWDGKCHTSCTASCDNNPTGCDSELDCIDGYPCDCDAECSSSCCCIGVCYTSCPCPTCTSNPDGCDGLVLDCDDGYSCDCDAECIGGYCCSGVCSSSPCSATTTSSTSTTTTTLPPGETRCSGFCSNCYSPAYSDSSLTTKIGEVSCQDCNVWTSCGTTDRVCYMKYVSNTYYWKHTNNNIYYCDGSSGSSVYQLKDCINFPSGSDGDECYVTWRVISPPGAYWRKGVWDSYENKCLITDGSPGSGPVGGCDWTNRRETTTVDVADTCGARASGDGECEEACGAPSDLDEEFAANPRIKDVTCPTSKVQIGQTFTISYKINGIPTTDSNPYAYQAIYRGTGPSYESGQCYKDYGDSACWWNDKSRSLTAPSTHGTYTYTLKTLGATDTVADCPDYNFAWLFSDSCTVDVVECTDDAHCTGYEDGYLKVCDCPHTLNCRINDLKDYTCRRLEDCSRDEDCLGMCCSSDPDGPADTWGDCVGEGPYWRDASFFCLVSSPPQWTNCDKNNVGVIVESNGTKYTCVAENGSYNWVGGDFTVIPQYSIIDLIVQIFQKIFSLLKL